MSLPSQLQWPKTFCVSSSTWPWTPAKTDSKEYWQPHLEHILSRTLSTRLTLICCKTCCMIAIQFGNDVSMTPNKTPLTAWEWVGFGTPVLEMHICPCLHTSSILHSVHLEKSSLWPPLASYTGIHVRVKHLSEAPKLELWESSACLKRQQPGYIQGAHMPHILPCTTPPHTSCPLAAGLKS